MINFRIHRLLPLVASFLLGVLIVNLQSWFGEGKRPARDAVLRLFPVRIEPTFGEDSVAKNIEVFLAPVEGVRTDSVYAVMIVVPTPHGARGEILRGTRRFSLRGFDSEMEKPVSIDFTKISADPKSPQIVVLDFLTWPNLTADGLDGKRLSLHPLD